LLTDKVPTKRVTTPMPSWSFNTICALSKQGSSRSARAEDVFASHVVALVPALAILTCISLTACGGGGDQTPKPPTLQTTSFTTPENESLSGNLGVQDPQRLATTVTASMNPAHGTLSDIGSNGVFTYQPNRNYSGSDSFVASVSDSSGQNTTAEVTITVQHVVMSPNAVADSTRTAPGAAVTVNVLSNDSDPRGEALTPKIVTQSPNGNAVVNSDGSVTFAPAPGFAGTTQLEYQDTNAEGDMSSNAVVQIQVRPLQKLVYLSLSQTVVFDDTNAVTVITNPIGAGSPEGLYLSRTGRTALYSTSGQSSGQAWYAADLQGTLTGQFVASTGSGIGTGSVVMNSGGTMTLYPIDQIVGILQSTEVFLGPGGFKVNAGDYSTEQVNDYSFGSQDRDIFYISHALTNYSSRSTLVGTTTATLGIATQLSPIYPDGDTVLTPIRTNASDSQIVYVGQHGLTYGLYEVNPASPGTEVLLGPTGIAGIGLNMGGFDIAAQGHYGAYVLRWAVLGTSGPAYAYLVNLDNPGSYAQIGSTFPNGTSLGTPLFSPGGKSVLLRVTTSSGTALYESAVAQPGTLTQMSPMYQTTNSIPVYQYTPDGKTIAYTVDATTTGSYDLYAIDRSKPGTAVQLNQTLGTSVFGPYISISADSTTIAYAQPLTGGGPIALFLVDRTTPGLPFKAADSIELVQYAQPQPFYIVP
jgi:Bacterial Ig domain